MIIDIKGFYVFKQMGSFKIHFNYILAEEDNSASGTMSLTRKESFCVMQFDVGLCFFSYDAFYMSLF